MKPASTSTLTLVLFVLLIVWRLYARLRRMIARQRLSKVRPWLTIGLYSTMLVILCAALHTHPAALWWLAGGLAMGSFLGLFALSKTRFERTPEGFFYTPHAPVGIALSLLFIARMAYRLVQVSATQTMMHPGQPDFARSPLTLAIFGLLASYFLAYAGGLVRWRCRVLRSLRQPQEREGVRVEQEPL